MAEKHVLRDEEGQTVGVACMGRGEEEPQAGRLECPGESSGWRWEHMGCVAKTGRYGGSGTNPAGKELGVLAPPLPLAG